MAKSFTIDHGIKCPPRGGFSEMQALREAIGSLKPDDSFVYDGNWKAHPYRAARQLGLKIVSRRDEKGGVRIWRVFGKESKKDRRYAIPR